MEDKLIDILKKYGEREALDKLNSRQVMWYNKNRKIRGG